MARRVRRRTQAAAASASPGRMRPIDADPRRMLRAVVAGLQAGQVVVVTLDLGAGRTMTLPPTRLVAGPVKALTLEGFGGLTPFVRYADGVVPPYLENVSVQPDEPPSAAEIVDAYYQRQEDR